MFFSKDQAVKLSILIFLCSESFKRLPSDNLVKLHYKRKLNRYLVLILKAMAKKERRMSFFFFFDSLQIEFVLVPTCHLILASETCHPTA